MELRSKSLPPPTTRPRPIQNHMPQPLNTGQYEGGQAKSSGQSLSEHSIMKTQAAHLVELIVQTWIWETGTYLEMFLL